MLHDDIISHLWKHFGPLGKMTAASYDKLEEAFAEHRRTQGPNAVHLRNAYMVGFAILLRKPVPFYFDYGNLKADEVVDPAIIATAKEFFHAGVLRLPYSPMLFVIQFNGSEKVPLILAEHNRDDKDKGPVVYNDELGPSGITIMPCHAARGRENAPVINYAGAVFRGAEKLNYIPFNYDSEEGPEAEQNIKTLGIVIDLALACILMMSMPHYTREKHEVPPKVNAKRIKNGKAPYQGWTKISLRREIVEAMNRGSMERGFTMRPHWRRGHIRTLGDGRKIPVRPCMINFEGDGELEKNIYFVEGANDADKPDEGRESVA